LSEFFVVPHLGTTNELLTGPDPPPGRLESEEEKVRRKKLAFRHTSCELIKRMNEHRVYFVVAKVR